MTVREAPGPGLAQPGQASGIATDAQACAAIGLGPHLNSRERTFDQSTSPFRLALLASKPASAADVRSHMRRVFFIGSRADHTDLAGEIRKRWDRPLVGPAHILEGEHLDVGGVSAEIMAAKASVLVLSEEALRDEQLVSMASGLNLAGVHIRDLRAFFEQSSRK